MIHPDRQTEEQGWRTLISSLTSREIPSTTRLPETLDPGATRYLAKLLTSVSYTKERGGPLLEGVRGALKIIARSSVPVSFGEIIKQLNPDWLNTPQEQDFARALQQQIACLRVTQTNLPEVINHMLAHYQPPAYLNEAELIVDTVEYDMANEVRATGSGLCYKGSHGEAILDVVDPGRFYTH